MLGITLLNSKVVILAIGTPIFRSVVGWAQRALADRKVTRFEWRQLVETISKVGTIAVAQYFIAAGFFGVDMDAVGLIATGAAAILTDKLFGSLKDQNNVTKR